MSFPKYEAYKDSGVEWLGKVPEHWDIVKISHTTSKITNGYVGPTRDILVNFGIRYIQSLHIKDGKILFERGTYFVEESWSKLHQKSVLEREDVLLVQTGDIGQTALVTDDHVGCNCHALIIMTPVKNKLTGAFLEFFLRSYVGQNALKAIQTGALHPHLNCSSVKDIKFAIPSIKEQIQVVHFLDRETARIDALIAEQERLIELLKEKRQAVISHAITKGIDPIVPIKDSGVEWLGEVPAHWEVAKVKHVIQCFEQGWSPQCENVPVESKDEWGVLKVGCVNGGIFSPKENKRLPEDLDPIPELSLKTGDVLISRANTRELVGSAALVDADQLKLMLSDKLFRLRTTEDILPEYLVFYLGTIAVRHQIELEATGASSSMLNISQAVIKELFIPVPSISEQQTITATLKISLEKLHCLHQEAELTQSFLQERRSALISAAVTGKIDVRGWKAPASESLSLTLEAAYG